MKECQAKEQYKQPIVIGGHLYKCISDPIKYPDIYLCMYMPAMHGSGPEGFRLSNTNTGYMFSIVSTFDNKVWEDVTDQYCLHKKTIFEQVFGKPCQEVVDLSSSKVSVLGRHEIIDLLYTQGFYNKGDGEGCTSLCQDFGNGYSIKVMNPRKSMHIMSDDTICLQLLKDGALFLVATRSHTNDALFQINYWIEGHIYSMLRFFKTHKAYLERVDNAIVSFKIDLDDNNYIIIGDIKGGPPIEGSKMTVGWYDKRILEDSDDDQVAYCETKDIPFAIEIIDRWSRCIS